MGDTKKSLQKETKNAKLNNPFDNFITTSASSKKTNNKSKTTTKRSKSIQNIKKSTKNVERTCKNFKKIPIFATIAFLLVGIIIGASVMYFSADSDYFNLNGSDEITLELGSTYTDEGASVKEFWLDLSNLVYAETNMKVNEDGQYYSDTIGTYYIAYKVRSFKYGLLFNVQKIRLVTFVEASEGGE